MLSYLSNLSIDSHVARTRLTSIICTIGPASNNVETLMQMFDAGMSIARLNFSHGSHEYHASTIRTIREAAKLYSETRDIPPLPVAIALDTKGPEIRTGIIDSTTTATTTGNEIELIKGARIQVTTDSQYARKCSQQFLYVDYENIVNIVKPNDRIYIDDGLISLLVIDSKPDVKCIECQIENGGKLGSQKGINLPGLQVDLPAISEKDTSDILFGVEQCVDMIFASFIRDAAGIHAIRKLVDEHSLKHDSCNNQPINRIMIIAKIENQQGIANIDEIIEAADGVMVARGDLGIEIPCEKVFLAQKMIISKCNMAGKPVICATQMLESMISKPRPTRAESSDVANAVLDGADCIMLSGETAKGAYPCEAVKMMHSIALEAEAAMFTASLFTELSLMPDVPTRVPPLSVNETSNRQSIAVAIAAVNASIKLSASAIIALTTTGVTAYQLAKYRPRAPIITITRNAQTSRQGHLYRAVMPMLYQQQVLEDWGQDVDARVNAAIAYGKRRNIIKSGDHVIVITGWRRGPGSTNTMRIQQVD
ncbi:Pyruvate kinase PKM, partial [Fragariocoptes setiger]